MNIVLGHLVSHRRTHTDATENAASTETPTEGEDCGDCNKCEKDMTERPERKHDIRLV